MRKQIPLMDNWDFTGPDGKTVTLNLPHTWNAIDGQDGGNDYVRGTYCYETHFPLPDFDVENQQVWIQFDGVNASAEVALNGHAVCRHDGGYSTFRANITDYLTTENCLEVAVDNSKNDRVYPQMADFTFYGGIYRTVQLLIVDKYHFALDFYGSPGIRVTSVLPKGTVDRSVAEITVETALQLPCEATVEVTLLDSEQRPVAAMTETFSPDIREKVLKTTLSSPHLWDGLEDPYLYTAVARLYVNDKQTDEIQTRFGIRSFYVDPDKGFFLNGRSYPLRGVCRHQDKKAIGNALTKEDHDLDMALIKEIGANTIRLAHYQHDQYFYDLCDEAGMIVWAEIPYISSHMPNGLPNTVSQMTELIYQNYNHPSIVCWGISNEITIRYRKRADMIRNHHILNDLCHSLDKTRFTTLACFAMCRPANPVAHITDVVSWNLYLGWYIPGMWLNDLWLWYFRKRFPKRAIGYSEYGAEAMTNLHSHKPKRNDHSEEYQAHYHEYMLKLFNRHPHMWATHCWNMFDFAADARNQGGEPGMNHKGLVTFDRQIKKDSFFLYKAWWSKEPMVHLCGKRYVDRVEPVTKIIVYSNQPKVALYHNDKLVDEKTGDKVFVFHVPMPVEQKANFKAVAGECTDEMTIRNVVQANIAYKLEKIKKKQKSNWV